MLNEKFEAYYKVRERIQIAAIVSTAEMSAKMTGARCYT
jgi:hypothetical protein